MTARTRLQLLGCGIAGAVAIGFACISVDPPTSDEPAATRAEAQARSDTPDPVSGLAESVDAVPKPAEKQTPPEPSKPAGITASSEPNGQTSLGEIPGFRLMGAVPEPSSATLCDDELWQRLGPVVQKVGAGEFFVNEEEWKNRPASYRVGVASFVSKCTQAEGSVSIRSDKSGELLAVYDSERGYVPAK